MPRLVIRTQPAHGSAPRYRAGLGPFGREPVVVEASPEQAEELRADPALLVAEVGAAASPTEPPSAPAEAAATVAPARKRKG